MTARRQLALALRALRAAQGHVKNAAYLCTPAGPARECLRGTLLHSHELEALLVRDLSRAGENP